ncbi:TrmH family RNA methyltransferase [Eudoraea chungangensis]|uniref:TrmH family RNA methyltransferase n=1 Tax=Eudoraea chungangensis TaxID=1481905 RepID=UPI0023EBB05D|nr:RNA methyltransferase [Eudoraea chungangensis]
MVDMALLAYLETFLTAERKERFLEVLNLRTKFLTVVMEDVYQLHNTSAVLRSCEVFGIQELHLIENRYGDRLDKNIAMGAEKWVDLRRYDDAVSCIKKLKSEGYRIVATSPDKSGKLVDNLTVDKPMALFFGTEKDGLTKNVFKKADDLIRIPMLGFTESLNISVAVAIILQQLSQRLRDSEVPWHLSEEEILEKRLDWAKKSIKSCDQIINRYYQKL